MRVRKLTKGGEKERIRKKIREKNESIEMERNKNELFRSNFIRKEMVKMIGKGREKKMVKRIGEVEGKARKIERKKQKEKIIKIERQREDKKNSGKVWIKI